MEDDGSSLLINFQKIQFELNVLNKFFFKTDYQEKNEEVFQANVSIFPLLFFTEIDISNMKSFTDEIKKGNNLNLQYKLENIFYKLIGIVIQDFSANETFYYTEISNVIYKIYNNQIIESKIDDVLKSINEFLYNTCRFICLFKKQ